MSDIKFEVKTYVPTEAANPMLPLIDAAIAQGEDAVIVFEVPKDTAASYAKSLVQKGARTKGHTARFVKEVEGKPVKADHLAFRLANKIERKAAESATVDEDAVPADSDQD